MLKGKRVLVTGGTSGIGTAIVTTLSESGASLGIHCHSNVDFANELVDKLQVEESLHKVFQRDLLVVDAAEKLICDFVAEFGGIDILINNAGWVFGSAHFLELQIEDWDRTFALNTRAPFLLSRLAFKYMQENGGGKIINISSVSAKYGGSAYTMHYGASKAALDALTIGLSRAGAEHDILVNSIRCGFIDTEFHRKMGRSETDIEKRIQLIPLKRPGKAVDIAEAVRFLAGSSGDFITGEILNIAGGD
jgi:3-oxoacyl-[acyl-carrier protein] reductase